MKNKRTDPPVTRNEFLKEISSIHEKLSKLATKEEIAKLATKEEIAKLATKEEFHRLANEVLNIKTELKEVREIMFTKEDGQRIIEHIDAFAQRMETYDRKVYVHDYRLNEHEERITRLEKSVSK